MKYNWRPDKVAFADFETQSRAELTTVHAYASHPSTRALCLCIKADDEMHRFGPYLDADAKEQIARITEGRTIVAHNAPFDSTIWETVEKLPPRTWFDTLPCARAAGFPGGLDKLSRALGSRGKDKNGKLLIDLLCKLRGAPPVAGPAHKLLMDYCVQDVEELETIYERVKDFGEPDVMDVDYAINRRGVPVDRMFAARLGKCYEQNKEIVTDEFDTLTGGVNPGSSKQVIDWLQSVGFTPKGANGKMSVGKNVVKELMADPEKFYSGEGELGDVVDIVRDALEMRREVVRVGKGKIDAILETTEEDGRIREQFVIYGAGPGRWAGRRAQFHNMPLAALRGYDTRSLEPEYTAIVEAAKSISKPDAKVAAADILNGMIRHIVRAPNLLIADYGAVEARCLAWISGCGKMLDIYADPHRSIYCDMGKQVYGKEITKDDKQEYALSKALVLGCGYGMSGVKFEMLCKSRNMTIETLRQMGLTPAEAVKVYRTTYPEVPALWREFDVAVKECITTQRSTVAGRCEFHMVGRDMHAVLPSSRVLVYRNARIEARVPGWQKLYGMPESPVPTVIYANPKGYDGFLYGAKTCENMCQAICRDFLAITLVHAEQLGLQPCLHVHDEVMCEADESRFAEFLCMMSDVPPWASGFPLLVEGYSGPLWTKTPKGYTNGDALEGRIIRMKEKEC
jgi:DNA polymerase